MQGCDKFHILPYDHFWEWARNAGQTKNLLVEYTPLPHLDTPENRMRAYNAHVEKYERADALCRLFLCMGTAYGYTFGRIN